MQYSGADLDKLRVIAALWGEGEKLGSFGGALPVLKVAEDKAQSPAIGVGFFVQDNSTNGLCIWAHQQAHVADQDIHHPHNISWWLGKAWEVGKQLPYTAESFVGSAKKCRPPPLELAGQTSKVGVVTQLN